MCPELHASRSMCCFVADGNAAVTGAYAALAEYYSNKQTKQNDCGLNLGWSHPNARATRKSVNNVKNCASPAICHCLGTIVGATACSRRKCSCGDRRMAVVGC